MSLAWITESRTPAKYAEIPTLQACSFSLSHEHCRLCCAHTLSDARISPRMCGARTFHEWYNQPLQHDAAAVDISNATMACSGYEHERHIKGRRRPLASVCPRSGWSVDMSAASRRTPVADTNAARMRIDGRSGRYSWILASSPWKSVLEMSVLNLEPWEQGVSWTLPETVTVAWLGNLSSLWA